jgi:hypothetical protein
MLWGARFIEETGDGADLTGTGGCVETMNGCTELGV